MATAALDARRFQSPLPERPTATSAHQAVPPVRKAEFPSGVLRGFATESLDGLLVINGVIFAYDKIPKHGRQVFEDWSEKALIGLFVAGLAIAGVVRAYMWISDQLTYLRGAFGGKLDAEDLLRTLVGFNFPGNTVRFVRAVRRGRRSEPSTSAHEITAALLLLAQGGKPTKWDWLPEDATLHIRIKRFAEEHRNRADLISELARLVEHH